MVKSILRFVPIVGVVGCYSYRPIELATTPVGTEVRARITGAASDRVAPLIGSLESRVLVGNVVENTSGTMTLEVPTGAMPNVAETVVHLRARVPLVAGDLVALEQRKLDVRRTFILGSGIAAGVALGAVLAIRSAADPQPGKIPTEPPPINRIPFLRLHF